MKYLVIIFLLVSLSSNAESCVKLNVTTYENNGATIEQCNDFVVMTSTQYNNIKGEVFDPAAYEIGLYGILKFFTAGIGIGAILALVSKLRR